MKTCCCIVWPSLRKLLLLLLLIIAMLMPVEMEQLNDYLAALTHWQLCNVVSWHVLKHVLNTPCTLYLHEQHASCMHAIHCPLLLLLLLSIHRLWHRLARCVVWWVVLAAASLPWLWRCSASYRWCRDLCCWEE
jgi:hypothetical protein